MSRAFIFIFTPSAPVDNDTATKVLFHNNSLNHIQKNNGYKTVSVIYILKEESYCLKTISHP